MDGHQLAREIIKKHGIDRYPTLDQALLKLATEVGELIDAYQKPGKDWSDFAKEYADVGLTLHQIGNLAFMNLNYEMNKVVTEETRRFA